MHRREGPKFPWGKVLGWVIPIALIIIVIIARSNAVDESERRNRAMSRTIVTSVPTIAIPTATTAPRATETPVVATAPTATLAGDCDTDFIGLDVSVEDAITRGYDINFAIIEESASPEEFASKRPDALREIANIWRDKAANSGAVPARLLGRIADIWEQGAAIAVDDAVAQARNLRSLADAYSNLADKFKKCDSTEGFAADLRQEAEVMRGLADELN